jgi:hypothetical protein
VIWLLLTAFSQIWKKKMERFGKFAVLPEEEYIYSLGQFGC